MKVRVINRKGHRAVVVYHDQGLQAVIVPAEAVKGNKCDDEALMAGIPYGLPWAEIIGEMRALPEEIEQALYRRGIWTREDLRADPMRAAAALMAAYGLDVQELNRRAIEYEIKEALT